MKKQLSIFIGIVLCGFSSFATTTYTVGASRTYTTIAAAYAACSGATDYVIEIYNDYSYSGETGGTANITLGSLASKSVSNTVTIRPASGQSLSFSSTATSIFYLDGANWVIFDGRAGGSGASAWTIMNINNNTIFTFINDASNNVVKYCLLKSDYATGGMFSFAGTTGITGNDNNTIDNCTLRENATMAYILVYSGGTASKSNSGNIVSNCNLINFTFSAIKLMANNSTWTITNNHFYQTASVSNTSVDHSFISIFDGNGYTITGNFLGGRAANCGGGSYVATGASGAGVYGVEIINSVTGVVNTISGNTFSNLTLTADKLEVGTKPGMALLYVAGTGEFVIGSSGNGNTFGATSGTSNITINYNNSENLIFAFNCVQTSASGTCSVAYNTFGAIDFYVNTAYVGANFSLIQVRGPKNITINNNTLGNTTANNIRTKSNSGKLVGIYFYNMPNPVGATSVVISNTTLQNFTTNNTAGGIYGKLYGIHLIFDFNTIDFNNNKITNFTYNTAAPDDNLGGAVAADFSGASLIGMYLQSAAGASSTVNVYDNRVSNLVSTSTAASVSVHVVGIYYNSSVDGTIKIYRNKVRGLSNASVWDNSGIIGLMISNFGVTTFQTYNNVILLSDSYTSGSKTMFGIYSVTLGNDEYYYNTVRLETVYAAGSGYSAAFCFLIAGDNFIVQNNIFQNLNSGGTGKHYAQLWDLTYFTPTSTAGIRYNYNETPVAGNLAFYGIWGDWITSSYTISGWRTLIGDGSSTELTGSISISSSTGVVSSSSIVGNAGTPIGTVTTDYDLNARDATNPWMGAFETITPLPIGLLEMSAKCQKSKTNNSEYGATIQWTTATEKNSDYFIVEGSADGFVWQVKDTISGAGTKYDPTSYYYHDDFINPTPENETVVYYRVSQTDFDGVVNTFGILSCKCEASDKIKIHPVPATEFIVINFGDQNNVPNSFQIMDIFGRIIEEVMIDGKEGNTSYELDISNYSSGRYIIKINDWKMKEDAVFIKK